MARTVDTKKVRIPGVSLDADVAEKLNDYRFTRRYDRLQDLIVEIITEFVDSIPDYQQKLD